MICDLADFDRDPSLAGVADPYPTYHWIRAQDPIHWSETLNAWLLTRHADALQLLHHHGTSRAALIARLREAHPDDRVVETQGRELPFLDGAAHDTLKRLLMRFFNPHAVAALRPRIEGIVNDLLTPALAAERMDVVAALGVPLPATVISEIIGLPREDVPVLSKAVDDLVAGRSLNRTAESRARGDASTAAFRAYFGPRIAERRNSPKEDLLGALVQEGLSDEDILAIVPSVYAGGQITLRDLLGTAVWTLLRHPQELARVVDGSASMAQAAQELLRYEPPIQAGNPLVLTEPLALADRTMPAGDAAVVVYGAVNRDPAHFPDPDRFDVGRGGTSLAFGEGAHFCLGAFLATLELEVALKALLRRAPGLRLVSDDLEWRREGRFRGPTAVWVTH